ncbi:MAG: hypothetical protein O7D86_10705 [Proteobacteria bacterium]|nr:hypothetical protein [Pseudomonadota bacterium]
MNDFEKHLMRIHFVCNVCGKKYVASEQQQGKSGECKNYGNKILVPILEDPNYDEPEIAKSQQDNETANAPNHYKSQEPNGSDLHPQLTSSSLSFARVLRFVILVTFNLSTFFFAVRSWCLQTSYFQKNDSYKSG